MTVAVIDIGTNTTLLLVTSIDSRGWLKPLMHEQRIPRLGRGVDASGMLLAEAMDRTIKVLLEYQILLESHRPDAVVVCGTSALRDARNSADFSIRVARDTGLALEILTGQEEALWTFRGALSGIQGAESATVVDIGGGSTEVIWGREGQLLGSTSMDIGAVRLTERYFTETPPSTERVVQAREWVRAHLSAQLEPGSAEGPLIGVAGTATSLALLDQGESMFSPERVANYRLPRRSVQRLLDRLLALTHGEIRALARALEGREDIIAAGALILDELMELLHASELVVSDRGVRYGLALREWEQRSGLNRATTPP